MTTISIGILKYAEGYDPLLKGFSEADSKDINVLKSIFFARTVAIALETIKGSGGL